jgi:hypothetical protein
VTLSYRKVQTVPNTVRAQPSLRTKEDIKQQVTCSRLGGLFRSRGSLGKRKSPQTVSEGQPRSVLTFFSHRILGVFLENFWVAPRAMLKLD